MDTTSNPTVIRLKHPCGYCATGRHDLCPGGIRHLGEGGSVKVWVCSCGQTPTCGRVRCTECGNDREQEVGPDWLCLDRDACHDVMARRRAANPSYVLSVQYRPTERIAKMADKKKVAIERRCVCCDKPTKGGRFLPGHDAKYVSDVVASVLAGHQRSTNARKALADISPALATKFDNSLARATKKASAETA